MDADGIASSFVLVIRSDICQDMSLTYYSTCQTCLPTRRAGSLSMRRKDRSVLSMPAAVRRGTIWPSRQRVASSLMVLLIEIIDSIGLVVVRALASRPSIHWRVGDGDHLPRPFAQRRSRAWAALIQSRGKPFRVVRSWAATFRRLRRVHRLTIAFELSSPGRIGLSRPA